MALEGGRGRDCKYNQIENEKLRQGSANNINPTTSMLNIGVRFFFPKDTLTHRKEKLRSKRCGNMQSNQTHNYSVKYTS